MDNVQRVKAWESLQELTRKSGLPMHYKEDLAIDKRVLSSNRYNHGYVGLLRETGTHLIPLKHGIDPFLLLGWREMESGKKGVVYHVSANGILKKVSWDKAEKLLTEPPYIMEAGRRTFEQWQKQVNEFIEDHRHLFCMFAGPEYPAEDWSKWKQWFGQQDAGGKRRHNPVMFKAMDQMLKRIRKQYP